MLHKFSQVRGFHLHGQRDFMLGPMDGEHPVELHLRFPFERHFTLYAIRPKDDLGEECALQDVAMHAAVACKTAAKKPALQAA